MAITERGYVHHQRDMKIRAVLDHGPGIFRNFAIKKEVIAIRAADCAPVAARAHAPAAAHAFIVIDSGLALFLLAAEADGAMRALAGAEAAAHA